MKKLLTGQEKGVIQFLLAIFIIGLAAGAYRDRKDETASLEMLSEMEAFREAAKTETFSAESNAGNSEMKPVAKHMQLSVNINLADKSELMKLPKIGPVTAERIIRFRDDYGSFDTIEDLSKVKGIGTKTLEKIRPFVDLK